MSISHTSIQGVEFPREGGLLFAVAKSFKAALRGVQMGRMIHVLEEFPDSQLEEMGISRSDIPEYAARLLEQE